MMNNKINPMFDVLIPVAQCDVSFVCKVVTYIRKYLEGASHIYIVTNQRHFKCLSKWAVQDGRCTLLDENGLLNGLSFQQTRRMLDKAGDRRPSSTGWYFQQLLKYAFALTEYAQEYYLTWDADTLPLNRIPFFENGQPLFTKKIEYHEPYFLTMRRLLGYGRQVDFSFIAENMLFKTSIVRELIGKIASSTIEGTTWMEKIVNACDFQDKRGNLYSEFETYGNFCIKNHPFLYGYRQLNTFRAAGLIRGRNLNRRIIERLSFDVNIASFEMKDAPFPHNLMWNLSRAKRKFAFIVMNRLFSNVGGGKLTLTSIECRNTLLLTERRVAA